MMEQRAIRSGLDERDVKTGRGGIRDIEYTVQFLQLLNGGDLPAVRQRNTLLALESLEIAGCLTQQETFILADAYRFLRKCEHRLQLLFDFQTHRLPDDEPELSRLARKMGATMTIDKFNQAYREKTRLDRTILDHLLHQTFADSTDRGEPESDLILDPNPDPVTIRETLDRYRFRDADRAFQNLLRLARESVPFLSARRCRHFLASIAPSLLQAVSLTPDPDGTLETLEKVTDSLGAKAVLYELFSANQASLKLYVDLCAGSPYLSSLLMNNPGMIDELLDSLVLDRPRTLEELHSELNELLRGASDPDPILFSFRDKELLRIGVRDLLGKEQIRQTTAALSDLAESVLVAAFDLAERELAPRFGTPFRDGNGQAAVIGLGKLGGQEIGYHSDLDLLVIFYGDNALGVYVTEWTQRAIRLLSKAGPHGKLFSVDMRLRPFGKSASLVIALDEFIRYGDSDSCQTWERQTLTRARIVKCDARFCDRVSDSIRQVILAKPWSKKVANDIAGMRTKILSTGHNLKRGTGGIVDMEFIVQMLQIKYGATRPEIVQPNMWDALEALKGVIPDAERTIFVHAYNYLRTIESRVRIVTDRPSVELPSSPDERDRLARRLGHVTGESLVGELDRVMNGVRWAYELLMTRETT
jgi:[glutamine synthetase] adenylyltransferase / [glutamine synthetase]-adenylyl-L-tyrosine phosphorylase